MFQNMKLRTKMVSGFLFVALIFAIVGVLNLADIHKITEADRKLYEDSTAPLPELAKIGIAFQGMRIASRDFINAQGDAVKRSQFEEQIHSRDNDLRAAADRFRTRNLSPEVAKAFADLEETHKSYEVYLDQILALAKEGKDKEAWGILWSEGYGNTAAIIAALALALFTGLWLPYLLTRSLARGIGRNSEALTASSQHLSAISHQMSASAEETSAQASLVAAAAEQATRNLQTVAAATEAMTASVGEISKSASAAAQVAGRAVERAEAATVTMKHLGESSTAIGEVLKVIHSIAQQTKLLALNATIEAARAGAAGKGFAVVANEVKELANQTAKATEQIHQKIEAILSGTEGAVDAITEIRTVIAQMHEISTTIASAVEEQTATTKEIARNVSEAVLGESQVTENISSVAEAAKSTSVGAQSTRTAASELARMAANLHKVIGASGSGNHLGLDGNDGQFTVTGPQAMKGRTSVEATT